MAIPEDNKDQEFPLFTTTGNVGYFHRAGVTYGNFIDLLDDVADHTVGTAADVHNNRLYRALKENKLLAEVLSEIIASVGATPACSFGEQALVLQLEGHRHLLRITLISEVQKEVLEAYMSGVVDTFSVVFRHKQSPEGEKDVVLSVTPYVNINDVTNAHVLALMRKYPPVTDGWCFTDAKPENVGLLEDGTPIIVDLGALRKIPGGERGDLLVSRIESIKAIFGGVGDANLPKYTWETEGGIPKQHTHYGDPRDSNLARKIEAALQRYNDRLTLKYISKKASAGEDPSLSRQ